MLTWLHVGDLHVTTADATNYRDFREITGLVAGLPQGAIDFVLLPGDNADNGTASQYRLVREALAGLPSPVHILPGDHDMEPGSLEAFHDALGAPPMPYAAEIGGVRCLFLDMVSAGTGGPDFRLDAAQLEWLERELASGGPAVLFMHSYPADLREGAARLMALLPRVACVDMGHTHYNELANDGRTIFMATRSTGQIEEGPVGFSVACLDDGVVSWRFKALSTAWPFVLITQPADRRLATGPARPPETVRAKILSEAPIASVEMRVDGQAWVAMTAGPDSVWTAPFAGGGGDIVVRARDARGRSDEDRVDISAWTPPARHADGSDADRLAAWPERGLLGTQLGPNRNGRKW